MTGHEEAELKHHAAVLQLLGAILGELRAIRRVTVMASPPAAKDREP